MEGDTHLGETAEYDVDFYPRPHMEGDVAPPPVGLTASYFYPRPHMEGDKNKWYSSPQIRISTHALTWRATL